MKEKKTILIVEDEELLRNVLREKLRLDKFSVLEASDGAEGLKLALAAHPDLILLDIVMPVMDGMTMLKKLRAKNEWGKRVPVILLTNLTSDNEERLRLVTETEPAYYLVKADWKIEDIVKKIHERLGE